MVWTPHWTKSAWIEVAHLSPSTRAWLIDGVRSFARDGGPIRVEKSNPHIGWLTVLNYEIEICRYDELCERNDDGEEIVFRNVIAVHFVVAFDPEIGLTTLDT